MATLHFKEYPYRRDLFALSAKEIEGEKFPNWEANANYSARTTVILQVDSYNLTSQEIAIAQAKGTLTIVDKTYSMLNVQNNWHAENVNFEEAQKQWANFELNLEREMYDLLHRLNVARKQSKLPTLFTGEWYINYGFNEKHIEVHEP